ARQALAVARDVEALLPGQRAQDNATRALQQFSTPLPIAVLAARLWGFGPESRVYEPTAGNGALLVEVPPAQVTAGEIDPARQNALRAQGISVTRSDALQGKPPKGGHSEVLANPPFGDARDAQGQTRTLTVAAGGRPAIALSRQDHKIALDSLDALDPGGTAVFILAGPPPRLAGEDARRKHYNSRGNRLFHWELARRGTTLAHFTLPGSTYRGKGAGWPIDIVVWQAPSPAGKAAGQIPLPGVQLPQMLSADTALDDLAALIDANARNGRFEPQRLGAALASGIAFSAGVGEDTRAETQAASVGREALDAQTAPTNEDAQDRQVAYRPASKAPALGTLVPRNLASALRRALNDLEKRHGDIDAWVASELGYADVEDLWRQPSGDTRCAAEQIDAFALWLDATQRDGSMVLGDQTGIGKGRVNAMAIRWAKRNGYTPIFGTSAPNLYNAIMRDLAAIGTRVTPFITNAGLTASKAITLQDGHRLETGTKADLDAAMTAMVESGKLEYDGRRYDCIFTTWPQTQTVDGADTVRRNFLRAFAKDNALIGDELHRVAGSGEDDRGPVGAPANRADFVRELLDSAGPVLHSSATWAKRPEVFDLYRRTDLGHAVARADEIGERVAAGGIPLVQALTASLTRAGQYVRRERDFSGSAYDVRIVPFDRAIADGFAAALEGIDRFDKIKNGALEAIARELNKTGRSTLADGATGTWGADSVNFSAIMHNLVSQFLLSGVADATASRAIAHLERGRDMAALNQAIEGMGWNSPKSPEAWRAALEGLAQGAPDIADALTRSAILEKDGQGRDWLAQIADVNAREQRGRVVEPEQVAAFLGSRKPIVALSSTMESFISGFAEDNGVAPGDPIAIDFRDLLMRYLERSRDVIEGDPYGEKTRRRITDAELGPSGVAAYEAAKRAIMSSGVDGLPISPIDWFHARLHQAGYKTGEMTGRGLRVDYPLDAEGRLDPKRAILTARSAAETSKAEIVRTTDRFNNGEIDAVVANQAGSEGLDLHSGRNFHDRRMRVMQIAQAEPDANVFMQLLGRALRSGQLVPPYFERMGIDIPAERRPIAIEAARMAKLNASTTAARRGFFMASTIDVINDIGDRAAARLLHDDYALNARLGNIIEASEAADDAAGKSVVRKLTGRLPRLPVAEQEAVWERLGREYEAELRRSETLGMGELEAPSLDLRAKPIDRTTIFAGARDAVETAGLRGPAFVYTANVRRLGHPLSTQEILNRIATFAARSVDSAAAAKAAGIEASTAQAAGVNAVAEARIAADARGDGEDAEVTRRTEREARRLRTQALQTTSLIQTYPAGQTVRLQSRDGTVFYGVSMGACVGTADTALGRWETAPSRWRLRVALADAGREVEIPFSQIASPDDRSKEGKFVLSRAETTPDGRAIWRPGTEDAFALETKSSRETRHIAAGNILAAFGTLEGRGRFVSFTDDSGRWHQGVMLPKDFDIDAAVRKIAVPLSTADAAIDWARAHRDEDSVVSTDGSVAIRCRVPDGKNRPVFELRIAASKRKGADKWADSELVEIAGRFERVAGEAWMTSRPLGADALRKAFRILQQRKSIDFVALDRNGDAARDAGLGARRKVEAFAFSAGAPGHRAAADAFSIGGTEVDFYTRIDLAEIDVPRFAAWRIEREGTEPGLRRLATSDDYSDLRAACGGIAAPLMAITDQYGPGTLRGASVRVTVAADIAAGIVQLHAPGIEGSEDIDAPGALAALQGVIATTQTLAPVYSAGAAGFGPLVDPAHRTVAQVDASRAQIYARAVLALAYRQALVEIAAAEAEPWAYAPDAAPAGRALCRLLAERCAVAFRDSDPAVAALFARADIETKTDGVQPSFLAASAALGSVGRELDAIDARARIFDDARRHADKTIRAFGLRHDFDLADLPAHIEHGMVRFSAGARDALAENPLDPNPALVTLTLAAAAATPAKMNELDEIGRKAGGTRDGRWKPAYRGVEAAWRFASERTARNCVETFEAHAGASAALSTPFHGCQSRLERVSYALQNLREEARLETFDNAAFAAVTAARAAGMAPLASATPAAFDAAISEIWSLSHDDPDPARALLGNVAAGIEYAAASQSDNRANRIAAIDALSPGYAALMRRLDDNDIFDEIDADGAPIDLRAHRLAIAATLSTDLSEAARAAIVESLSALDDRILDGCLPEALHPFAREAFAREDARDADLAATLAVPIEQKAGRDALAQTLRTRAGVQSERTGELRGEFSQTEAFGFAFSAGRSPRKPQRTAAEVFVVNDGEYLDVSIRPLGERQRIGNLRLARIEVPRDPHDAVRLVAGLLETRGFNPFGPVLEGAVEAAAAKAVMLSTKPLPAGIERLSLQTGLVASKLELARAAPLSCAASANLGWIRQVQPAIDAVFLPDGKRVRVEYRIVELADLVASHDADGAPNPEYPAELQPRDRSRTASTAQIATMASALIPELLMPAARVTTGAPVVDPIGIVESGNGRIAALRRVYEENGERLQAYRAAIAAAVARGAVSVAVPEGQRVDASNWTRAVQPVLVAVRIEPLSRSEREAFVRDANARDTLAPAAGERARSDASQISAATLGLALPGDPLSRENRPFLKALVSDIAERTELSAIFDKQGLLSADGLGRVEAALLARAFPDAPDLIDRMAERADGGALTRIRAALVRASAIWAREVPPGHPATAGLIEALRLVARARDAGQRVADHEKQLDLIGGDTGALASAWLGIVFADEDRRRPAPIDALAAAIEYAAEEIGKSYAPGQTALFAGEDKEDAEGRAAAILRRAREAKIAPQAQLALSAGAETADAETAATALNARARLLADHQTIDRFAEYAARDIALEAMVAGASRRQIDILERAREISHLANQTAQQAILDASFDTSVGNVTHKAIYRKIAEAVTLIETAFVVANRDRRPISPERLEALDILLNGIDIAHDLPGFAAVGQTDEQKAARKATYTKDIEAFEASRADMLAALPDNAQARALIDRAVALMQAARESGDLARLESAAGIAGILRLHVKLLPHDLDGEMLANLSNIVEQTAALDKDLEGLQFRAGAENGGAPEPGRPGGPQVDTPAPPYEVLAPGDIPVRFKDVAGAESAVDRVREYVDCLRDPARYARLGAKAPDGTLLVGDPGTGKTHLARALAGEAGVPVLVTSAGRLEGEYRGGSAKLVRQLFAAARELAPCVVFIDEVDGVGSRMRSQGKGDREIINELLVEIDGFATKDPSRPVLLLAATNDLDGIDPALRRSGRFTNVVSVPLPDEDGRRAILYRVFRDRALHPDYDVAALAARTKGFGGADLEALANKAALNAGRAHAEGIAAEHIDAALAVIGPRVEQRQTAIAAARKVAQHATALALRMSPATDALSPSAKVDHALSLVEHQQAAGPAWLAATRADLEAALAVALAPRAYELEAHGAAGTSVASVPSFARAVSLADAMVQRFGMRGDGRTLTDQGVRARVGIRTVEDSDAEADRLVQRAMHRARLAIRANRSTIDVHAARIAETGGLAIDDAALAAEIRPAREFSVADLPARLARSVQRALMPGRSALAFSAGAAAAQPVDHTAEAAVTRAESLIAEKRWLEVSAILLRARVKLAAEARRDGAEAVAATAQRINAASDAVAQARLGIDPRAAAKAAGFAALASGALAVSYLHSADRKPSAILASAADQADTLAIWLRDAAGEGAVPAADALDAFVRGARATAADIDGVPAPALTLQSYGRNLEKAYAAAGDAAKALPPEVTQAIDCARDAAIECFRSLAIVDQAPSIDGAPAVDTVVVSASDAISKLNVDLYAWWAHAQESVVRGGAELAARSLETARYLRDGLDTVAWAQGKIAQVAQVAGGIDAAFLDGVAHVARAAGLSFSAGADQKAWDELGPENYVVDAALGMRGDFRRADPLGDMSLVRDVRNLAHAYAYTTDARPSEMRKMRAILTRGAAGEPVFVSRWPVADEETGKALAGAFAKACPRARVDAHAPEQRYVRLTQGENGIEISPAPAPTPLDDVWGVPTGRGAAGF
ncbi:MAG: AAA family ATPase, partial [Alphaproteobacteria bacterium]|nr:AAA family ATPase [Alphaproteobacteria bacterium]